jgi:hypothetical protein
MYIKSGRARERERQRERARKGVRGAVADSRVREGGVN